LASTASVLAAFADRAGTTVTLATPAVAVPKPRSTGQIVVFPGA